MMVAQLQLNPLFVFDYWEAAFSLVKPKGKKGGLPRPEDLALQTRLQSDLPRDEAAHLLCRRLSQSPRLGNKAYIDAFRSLLDDETFLTVAQQENMGSVFLDMAKNAKTLPARCAALSCLDTLHSHGDPYLVPWLQTEAMREDLLADLVALVCNEKDLTLASAALKSVGTLASQLNSFSRKPHCKQKQRRPLANLLFYKAETKKDPAFLSQFCLTLPDLVNDNAALLPPRTTAFAWTLMKKAIDLKDEAFYAHAAGLFAIGLGCDGAKGRIDGPLVLFLLMKEARNLPSEKMRSAALQALGKMTKAYGVDKNLMAFFFERAAHAETDQEKLLAGRLLQDLSEKHPALIAQSDYKTAHTALLSSIGGRQDLCETWASITRNCFKAPTVSASEADILDLCDIAQEKKGRLHRISHVFVADALKTWAQEQCRRRQSVSTRVYRCFEKIQKLAPHKGWDRCIEIHLGDACQAMRNHPTGLINFFGMRIPTQG